ncbi:hypothetical protein N2152v2_000573 [Parachlorella kessleri]
MALQEFLQGPTFVPELDAYGLGLLDEEQAESGEQGYYSGSGGATPTSSGGVTALGLGGAAGGRKPSKGKGSRGPRPRLFKKGTCQADGCEADLTPLPFYNQRNHICMAHKKAEDFTKLGETVRFCQRCGVSHPLGDFEGVKRSCRKQLAKHNSRRRKQGASPTATSSGSPASPVDSGACATSAPALSPLAPAPVVDLFASDLTADLHLAGAVAPAGGAAGALELGAAALGSRSLPAAAGAAAALALPAQAGGLAAPPAAALPPLLPPPPPPTIEDDPLDEPWWHDLLAGADGSDEQQLLAVAAAVPQQQQHAAPTAASSHERVCGARDERAPLAAWEQQQRPASPPTPLPPAHQQSQQPSQQQQQQAVLAWQQMQPGSVTVMIGGVPVSVVVAQPVLAPEAQAAAGQPQWQQAQQQPQYLVPQPPSDLRMVPLDAVAAF